MDLRVFLTVSVPLSFQVKLIVYPDVLKQNEKGKPTQKLKVKTLSVN